MSGRLRRSRGPLAPLLAAGLALLPAACGGEGEDVPARLERARALEAAGRFEAAVPVLREVLDAHPGHPEGAFRLGRALLRTGRPTRALWALAEAARVPAYAEEAGRLLASTLLATGHPGQAVDAVDRALEAGAEGPEALALRARAHLAAGDGERALADAERLLAEEPESPARLELRARALAALDRLDEADAAFRAIAERPRAEEGGAASACLAWARFLAERREDAERAAAVLEECVARAPADPRRLERAVALYDELERPEAATRLLRAALEAAPESDRLRARLAERERAAGRVEEAERLLREAAEGSGGAPAWRELADLLRGAGRAEAAQAALERALARARSDEERERVRFVLADLLAQEGDTRGAEAHAAELEEPVYGHLVRGRILLERGEPRAALEAIEAGVRLWPNNPGARYLAGGAAESVGDLSRALSEYREAVRADPEATDARAALARLHLALGEPRTAFEFAAAFTRTHPGATEGYVLGARAAADLGRFGAGRALLERLEGREGARAAAVVERATLEREARGPGAAARVVEASELDLTLERHEEALRALVRDLVAEGRAADALARVEAALEERPHDPSLHDLRARTLERTGAGREAVRDAFERALSLDSAHAPALAGLATLAARAGEGERAVALYDRAARADPGDPEPAYAAARVLLGAGAVDEAVRHLGALLERHPLHAAACNDLAWLLAEQGEALDRALTLAERARRLGGGANALDTLGWVHYRRGELDAAEAALARAARASDDPSVHYRLGVVRDAKGEASAAARAFETALAGGEFREAPEARAAVARLSAAGETP